MADKTDRGTHNDPAWESRNLTGGHDSGAARVDFEKMDVADGPDVTARLLEATPADEFGFPQPIPASEEGDWLGTKSHPKMGEAEVTDDSGRIASSGSGHHGSDAGGARDPQVNGIDKA